MERLRRYGPGGSTLVWSQLGGKTLELSQGGASTRGGFESWWPNPWRSIREVIWPMMMEVLRCQIPGRAKLLILKAHVGMNHWPLGAEPLEEKTQAARPQGSSIMGKGLCVKALLGASVGGGAITRRVPRGCSPWRWPSSVRGQAPRGMFRCCQGLDDVIWDDRRPGVSDRARTMSGGGGCKKLRTKRGGSARGRKLLGATPRFASPPWGRPGVASFLGASERCDW